MLKDNALRIKCKGVVLRGRLLKVCLMILIFEECEYTDRITN